MIRRVMTATTGSNGTEGQNPKSVRKEVIPMLMPLLVQLAGYAVLFVLKHHHHC